MTPSTLYTSADRSSRVAYVYILHSQLVVLHLEQTVIYCVPHHQSCEMSFLVLADSAPYQRRRPPYKEVVLT